MNKPFMLLLMVFCHVVDDYCLQGILASMKQKLWWKKQEQYNDKYQYDYIVALFMHSFSWTFMVMLPISLVNSFSIGTRFLVVFAANVLIHGIVDDLKANRMKINLWQDQLLHMLQIIITVIILK